jgi:muconolactone D-isomerase
LARPRNTSEKLIEFLVEIETSLPPDMGAAATSELLEREHQRGLELRESAAILRIWRIPGQFANVGIWSAEDATALHDSIASLPLFPWMSVQVTPLATHPLERDRSHG